MQNRTRFVIAAGSLLALVATSIPGSGADGVPPTAARATKANYELAAEQAGGEPQQQLGGRRGTGNFGPTPNRTQKQPAFEYELASGRLTLLEDPPKRKPAWASISPDDKTVVFARNHNLYMMDAENYAKAVKDVFDATSNISSEDCGVFPSPGIA